MPASQDSIVCAIWDSTSCASSGREEWEPVWTLPPQPLEPRGIGGGVSNREVNVPVAGIVLYQPRICALIRQRIAARVSQHVQV